MKKLPVTSLDQIPQLAKTIAKGIRGGEIFGLIGHLGSGKTTFVKAVAKELKIKRRITSPTFGLLHAFFVKVKNKKILFCHLDLYRTKNFKEIAALGLPELWGKPETVVFIEWADKIKKRLPAQTKIIKFKNF